MKGGFTLDSFQDTDQQSPNRIDKRLETLRDLPSHIRNAECATALTRQFIARNINGMNDPIVQMFESVFPRGSDSVTSKSVLCKLLGLQQDSDEPMLEKVALSCLQNYSVGSMDDAHYAQFKSLPPQTQVRELAVSLLKQHVSVRSGGQLSEAVDRVLPKNKGVSVSKLTLLAALTGVQISDGCSALEGAVHRDIEQSLAMGIQEESGSAHFEFNDDNQSVDINGFRVTDTANVATVVGSLDELDFSSAVELGVGAGGSVAKVFHARTNSYFAVKEIRLSESSMVQAQAEMMVVYGTSKSQVTQNCVSLISSHGVFYRALTLYIVLELMGGSLKSLVMKKPMYEAEIAAVVFQSLHGLRFLHDVRKQMHRDIKPHNILYRPADGLVKLADFGIASRAMESVNFGKFETQCGTLAYLSPARVESESSPYGPESDIWSFGVTVLELALGAVPFQANPFVIGQLKHNPPRLPASSPRTGEHFSSEFQDFVAQCCSLSPPPLGVISNHPFVTKMNWDTSRQIVSTFV